VRLNFTTACAAFLRPQITLSRYLLVWERLCSLISPSRAAVDGSRLVLWTRRGVVVRDAAQPLKPAAQCDMFSYLAGRPRIRKNKGGRHRDRPYPEQNATLMLGYEAKTDVNLRTRDLEEHNITNGATIVDFSNRSRIVQWHYHIPLTTRPINVPF
jgi:hypothetical protein